MSVLGHRGPRTLLSAGATVASPLGSHTHILFPPSLSFPFFALSLCSVSLGLSLLAMTIVHKVLREYPADCE